MLTLCAWCRRETVDGVPISEPRPKGWEVKAEVPVSHGLCLACLLAMEASDSRKEVRRGA